MRVTTAPLLKRAMLALTGGLAGLAVMAATPASANAYDKQVSKYEKSDHRAHHNQRKDRFTKDRFHRADPYRRNGVRISVNTRDRYNRDNRFDNRYDNRRRDRRSGHYDNRRRGSDSKVIKRERFRTRYNARIVLTEEVIYGRRGNRLVCTVAVRGPEADCISRRRLNRIANNYCSRDARVRILA
ncbi:MAG: hypothetical protein AAGH42_08725 [Pseudomonadota bacterium]